MILIMTISSKNPNPIFVLNNDWEIIQFIVNI